MESKKKQSQPSRTKPDRDLERQKPENPERPARTKLPPPTAQRRSVPAPTRR
jgi:hypothetical protein